MSEVGGRNAGPREAQRCDACPLQRDPGLPARYTYRTAGCDRNSRGSIRPCFSHISARAASSRLLPSLMLFRAAPPQGVTAGYSTRRERDLCTTRSLQRGGHQGIRQSVRFLDAPMRVHAQFGRDGRRARAAVKEMPRRALAVPGRGCPHAGSGPAQWLASVCAPVFQTIYVPVVQCIAGDVAVHV